MENEFKFIVEVKSIEKGTSSAFPMGGTNFVEAFTSFCDWVEKYKNSEDASVSLTAFHPVMYSYGSAIGKPYHKVGEYKGVPIVKEEK